MKAEDMQAGADRDGGTFLDCPECLESIQVENSSTLAELLVTAGRHVRDRHPVVVDTEIAS